MSEHLQHDLGIGELHVGHKPTIISTILGSCVSVCLFSEAHRVGGLIHFALPDISYTNKSERNDLNFADQAIKKLINELLKVPGLKLKDLKAKITGGCSSFKNASVGDSNVMKAREILKTAGISVVGEHVGGDRGRKIYFYTDTGRLRVSLLEAFVKEPAITNKKVRVLVVDDSKVMQNVLKKILSTSDIEIVGTAANATEAEKLIQTVSPDVITLDIHMPGMDGVTLLKKYIVKYPIPTIMVTSINIHESDLVFKALEIGAVDYIQKPSFEEIAEHSELIREKVRIAATIKVKGQAKKIDNEVCNFNQIASDKLIAIGASTGGTEAIKQVLLDLPSHIPPIVIVQHIPPVFSTAFAKRLNDLCPFEVKEASDGDEIKNDRVLIAPGGLQMRVKKSGTKLTVEIFDGEKVNRHKPSVDVLFNSVAQIMGKNALGVILTGMGDDGARGLLNMKNAGAFTIGQDQESSVVYGMPKAAKAEGAVMLVCPLKEIAAAIALNFNRVKSA